MQIGVYYPSTVIAGDLDAARAHAQAAEAAGYAHYLVTDHVLGVWRDRPGGFAGRYDHSTKFTDPFVLFAYLSGVTTSMRFLSGVLVLPQRQAAVVAKQVADLAWISGGRFTLGVGSGWNALEYEGLGEDFSTRGRRLEEQVRLIRELLEHEVVQFQGRWHHLEHLGIAPRPPFRVPIWMGGTADAVLDRVGRLADGWLPLLRDVEQFSASRERIRAAASAAGRNPDDIAMSTGLTIRGDDRDIQRAHAWQEAGVTHLHINTMDSGWNSTSAQIRALEQFMSAWQDSI